jgi:hypothetical protein
MGLWRRVVALVDPAQGYFDGHGDAPHGPWPLPRGAITYGPGVPGGSRAATEAEVEELVRRHAREHRAHADERAARRAQVDQRWGAHVLRAAHELLANGETRLEAADHVVTAKIVRFWRGDPVLHIVRDEPGGGTESIARLPRRDLDGQAGVALLVTYLTAAVAR